MIGPLSVSNLPAIWFDGYYRVLGLIPSTEESKASFPSFSSSFMSLGSIEWREIDLSHFKNPIWNQKATSSCVSQGCLAGSQTCWMQSGKPFKEFNPYFTYGLINGGKDAGAMISDGIKALMQYGACPKEDLPPGLMFKNQFPQKAFENAKRFKLEKAYRCETFEEICTAITLGFVVPLGILVGSNFPNVDSEGVPPLPKGQGGGHCILGVGLKKIRDQWHIKIQNSWGSNYGWQGFAFINKQHFAYMNPDATAIQSITDDPLDTTPEDEVPTVIN